MRKAWWLWGVMLAGGLARAADPYVAVIGIIGGKAVLKIDGQQVILQQGQTEDGVQLVSVDARGAVVAVGGRQHRVELGMDTGPVAPRVDHSIDIPMNEQGEYLVSGFINGQPADLLVDTGANIVSMTAAQADHLGISYRGAPQMEVANAGASTVTAWIVTLASIRVGPIVAHGVEAAVRDTTGPAPILLGMTFLNQVTVIKQGNSMRLTER